MDMDIGSAESCSCSSKDCTEDASSLFYCKICWQLAEEPIVTQCGVWTPLLLVLLYSWLRYYSKYRKCPVCRAVIKEHKLVPLYGIESRGKEAKDFDYVPKF